MLPTYMQHMRNNNWRLGLRAPLVTRKTMYVKTILLQLWGIT